VTIAPFVVEPDKSGRLVQVRGRSLEQVEYFAFRAQGDPEQREQGRQSVLVLIVVDEVDEVSAQDGHEVGVAGRGGSHPDS
jgi:hypothetical protein